MQKTVHEGILSYMKLSENESQTGYPILLEGAKISWYKLYKKTKESIVKKWLPLEKGIVKYPCSLEDLLGVYVVDKCGNLAALFEDTIKNIIPKPKSKCTCTGCDTQECMCPTVQDSLIQIPITIDGVPYTNKKVSRLLKNGNVVEESSTWVQEYKNNTVIGVSEIVTQKTICQVETLPCGCPVNCEENAQLLFNCGCICDWDVPYMRDRYPAMYNDFGYYKKDEDKREINVFNSEGKISNISHALIVFQSNGEDMLIPEYALMAFLSLLDWTKKQFSPSYLPFDKKEAKKNYRYEELEMLKHLNPIPYELMGRVGPMYGTNRSFKYNGVHSDFINQNVQNANIPGATAGVQNITNIIGGGGGLPPFIGVVDGGSAKDPIAGLTSITHDDLKNLGATNGNRIEIKLDSQALYNFGLVPSFTYDPTAGTITLLNGIVWPGTGSILRVERPQ